MTSVPISDDDLTRNLVAGGLPEAVARMIVAVGTGQRVGYFDVRSRAVEALTGEPPRSIRARLLADTALQPR